MDMIPDGELLRRYVEAQSEEAFAELVQRYVNLVYSAALRQVGGDDALARDISQQVFADLARKAGTLVGRTSVIGWLYKGVRFAVVNAIRAERRRAEREKEAHAMRELLNADSPEPDWNRIQTVLDDAMHELKETDREAILLRYFENLALQDVGRRLGLSENTARMRVERAMERLRSALDRRGMKTSMGLGAALAAHAVQAAPAGVAGALISTSIATAGTSPVSLLAKVVLMSKIKTMVGVLALAGLSTALIVEHLALTRQQLGNAALRQQLAQLQSQTNKPPRPISIVTNLPEDQLMELLRLRGEVAVLKDQARTNRTTVPRPESAPEPNWGDPEVQRQLFLANSAYTGNALKNSTVAMVDFARDHNGAFPTNFEMLTQAVGGDKQKNKYDTMFEFVTPGLVDASMPEIIVLRERQARRAPDGNWERAYGLSDGSVQIIQSTDGTFDFWEQDRIVQTPDP
jgi:RNA polymerase sigma factor (sigma-70 family)